MPSILFEKYLLAYCFRQSHCSSLRLLASMHSPLSHHAQPQTPNPTAIEIVVECFDRSVERYLNLSCGVEVLVIVSIDKLKVLSGVHTSRATLILWPVVESSNQSLPCTIFPQNHLLMVFSPSRTLSKRVSGVDFEINTGTLTRHEDRSISAGMLVSHF